MADGTESQASDDAHADQPGGSAPREGADTDRVARIVAALRTAHAARTAATAAASAAAAAPAAENPEPAETPEAPAPRRTTSGVRPTVTTSQRPTLRWNPGARYRASRLADRPALPVATLPAPQPSAALPPVPPPPAPMPPVAMPPVPMPPVPGPPPLAGRLYRGPARRTAVFEREIWHPTTRSSRVPRDVGDALIRAVERYRTGSLSTTGLVHAIARAHAA